MFLERLATRVTVAGWNEQRLAEAIYGTIHIKDYREEVANYRKLDATGELIVNKQARMSSQMFAFNQASISDECALKVVNSRERLEIAVTNRDDTKSQQQGTFGNRSDKQR